MLNRCGPEGSGAPEPIPACHVRRGSWCSGLTVLELLIVLAILSTLAAIAIPAYSDVTEKARIIKAIAEIRALEGEVAVFEANRGRLPTNLAEIARGNLVDPWGNPYEYLNFAEAGPGGNGKMRKDRFLVPLNSTYDLYAKGKDGVSRPPLTAKMSLDDVVRANDGGYVGLAENF
jgi:general secretion pathway protein G